MKSILGFIAVLALSQSAVSVSTAYARTSEDNRTPGSVGLGLGLGTFLFPVSGTSLALDYNLTPSLQLEFRGASGDFNGDDLVDSNYDTVYVHKLNLDAQLYEARAKLFLGNSFYFAGGLGQRHLGIDVEASDFQTQVQGDFTADSTCFQFGLGNIWTLDSGLFLGAEWLAFSIPLSSTSSSSYNVRGASDADTEKLKRDTQDVADRLGKVTSVGLLTFHIGYQF